VEERLRITDSILFASRMRLWRLFIVRVMDNSKNTCFFVRGFCSLAYDYLMTQDARLEPRASTSTLRVRIVRLPTEIFTVASGHYGFYFYFTWT
jgi:hypothetical protein